MTTFTPVQEEIEDEEEVDIDGLLHEIEVDSEENSRTVTVSAIVHNHRDSD